MNVQSPKIQVTIGRPTAAEATPPKAGPARPAGTVTHTPPIDIYETSDGLVLEADLPGAAESSLNVQLEDNVLSLYAKVDAAPPREARLIHEEYRVGEFYRSFILSDEVDRDGITAELRHGVLRLHLPKAERARTRRIEVKAP